MWQCESSRLQYGSHGSYCNILWHGSWEQSQLQVLGWPCVSPNRIDMFAFVGNLYPQSTSLISTLAPRLSGKFPKSSAVIHSSFCLAKFVAEICSLQTCFSMQICHLGILLKCDSADGTLIFASWTSFAMLSRLTGEPYLGLDSCCPM